MTPYYDQDGITIYVGDNRDVLPYLENISAVVTDPPYGLSFMGKDWDHSVPGEAFWRIIADAMKPGAHLLSFGGSRTYHRMGVAIEDAGLELRDTLMWLYGSGMPKGWNFSNRIPDDQWCRCTGGNAVSYDHEGSDHGQPQTEHNLRSMRHADIPASVNTGAERREVLHTSVPESSLPAYREANSTGFYEGREQPGMEGRAIHRAGEGVRDGAPAEPSPSTAQRVCAGTHSGSGTDARQTAGTGRGSASHQSATGRQSSGELAGLPEPPRPLDDRALRDGGACPRCGKLSQDFRGFDVALKPAHEPVILARKPLCGTVAANVLAHGTGALNIDASRIGFPPGESQDDMRRPDSADSWAGWAVTNGGQNTHHKLGKMREGAQGNPAGRWPANVILDEDVAEGHEWSRYFYCAKASRSERNAGLDGMPEVSPFERGGPSANFERMGSKSTARQNHHPTVKPLALMRYLVTLITPPGGIVLDPFAGSGSTLVACAELGFPAIGIELSEEYAEIAARRVRHAQQQTKQAVLA